MAVSVSGPDNETYIITTNQQVSLCQPKVIIKAALPNQQLHAVVCNNLPCCTFTVSIPGQKMTSFLQSVTRDHKLCLTPIAQEYHSLSQLPVLSKWCNSQFKDTVKHLPWTPRSYQEQDLVLFAVTFLVVTYLWRNVSLCALPLSPTITVP